VRKSLVLTLCSLILTSCASLENSTEVSVQQKRLSDVASNTLELSENRGGVIVQALKSEPLVISSDSRFVQLDPSGLLYEVSSGDLYVPPEKVRYVMSQHYSSEGVSDLGDKLALYLPSSHYLRLNTKDTQDLDVASNLALSILPVLSLVKAGRCVKDVSLTARKKLEFFRVSLNPDCVLDSLDLSVHNFTQLISEDLTIAAKGGVVSRLGPTGSSHIDILSFTNAPNENWDGSYISIDDLAKQLKLRPDPR
jgi:hypothetical protein